MSNIILKIENLSKQYRLGLVGTGTLSHDLNRWWHNFRGKEDPYLKIGDINDRSKKGSSDYVWALKDINFEVQQGEVLGIIGKNGAGKSTLLKILSKITAPTTGSVKFNGRIASLLEVGTGFHGEMTGRENIFLNGAILGMTKKEITDKLDEIIEFSGCERYIDTPVKRYSSGMTVRLAFAVAAFLEPDILIIDEVLAVGDAEFQKKAIGKMQEISKGEGRTVLFVSHNMAAVQSLCTRAILLDNGEIITSGEVETVLEKYLFNRHKGVINKVVNENFDLKIIHNKIFDFNEKIKMTLKIDSNVDIQEEIFVDFAILNRLEEFVLHYKMSYANELIRIKKGINTITFSVDNPRLVLGEYTVIIYIYDKMKNVKYWAENITNFQISNLSNSLIVNMPIKSNVMHKVIVENNIL
jgi:lipopolysaccharide transport system ATP-binding protein